MSSNRQFLNSKKKRKVIFSRNPRMSQTKNLVEQDGTDPTYNIPCLEQVPAMHRSLPFIIDELETETSQKQLSTVRNVLKFVNDSPLPLLDRATHVEFLLEPLEDGLSSGYTGLDASRPWLLYWCINALALLGEDVGDYNDRVVSSLKPLQHKDGGFGGGNGQSPHMASAYASVLTLVITSYYASKNLSRDEQLNVYARSFSWIDRKKLLEWIRKTKLPNGGFKVNEEGEEDVRAGYCALVVLALLGYDGEELKGDTSVGQKPILDGVLEYFKTCQTWEGGIGAKQNSEAHGGYAFCVLSALCLLGEPGELLPRYLDLNQFIMWLSARQYAPEGGFSGRTNKLVDGCYSTWVGGCWSLVEAATNGMESKKVSLNLNVGSIWNRRALIRYILTCCQDPHGGLRDKPGLRPDYYHSNYVLIGLSAAQHYYYYDNIMGFPSSIAKSPFKHSFLWKASRNVPKPSSREGIGGGWEEGLVLNEDSRVGTQHPLFNIPLGAEIQIQDWWEAARDSIEFS
ncbi:hypothetical protein AA313_de0201189 [Arthrobotrys entomopaga]|nr:hypothetical protein AA313_de0201189 [Arthrobotrys entomopaga]